MSFDKKTKVVRAFKISEKLHGQIWALARASSRNLNDQIRFLMEKGVEECGLEAERERGKRKSMEDRMQTLEMTISEFQVEYEAFYKAKTKGKQTKTA